MPDPLNLNAIVEQIDESLDRDVPALFAKALNCSGPLVSNSAPHWRALADELDRVARLAREAAEHA